MRLAVCGEGSGEEKGASLWARDISFSLLLGEGREILPLAKRLLETRKKEKGRKEREGNHPASTSSVLFG